MKVGDLVRMRRKNYSSAHIRIPDQWHGLTGIIVDDLTSDSEVPAYAVLIKHPDDSTANEVLVFKDDMEVINEGG